MKSLWTMFIQSLQLPKKQAAFSLNRIGMDITVIYMFILLWIASIPTFILQLQENERLSTFFFAIFFFIFHYLPVVILVFLALSIIAWIGSLIAKLSHRKLRFSIHWKMAASASTIPLLIFTAVSFFYQLNMPFLLLSIGFIFFILVRVILIYPKRRQV